MKETYWVLYHGGIGDYEIVSGEEVETDDGGLYGPSAVYGPFDTFREAKRYAIDGCKTDITTARIAIARLRSLKKKDCE